MGHSRSCCARENTTGERVGRSPVMLACVRVRTEGLEGSESVEVDSLPVHRPQERSMKALVEARSPAGEA